MSEHFHAIVWIDHREAKIFEFGADDVERVVVPSHATGRHLQHRANVTGSGHRGVDKEFFQRVAAALTHTGAILITGPAQAKLELKNYIAEHSPELARRISGVEALDHPSDSALVALARKFFRADDRMHAQTQTP
jgi:stalled ribosome rescue protein Dom34